MFTYTHPISSLLHYLLEMHIDGQLQEQRQFDNEGARYLGLLQTLQSTTQQADGIKRVYSFKTTDHVGDVISGPHIVAYWNGSVQQQTPLDAPDVVAH